MAVATATVRPARAGEVEDELTFASGLIERGFPDYAERVLGDLLARYPDRAEAARRVQAELHMAQRDFAAAEDIVRTFPADTAEGRAVRVKLANAYYLVQETDKAKALYDEFFAVYRDQPPTDPELLRFYRDAAWRFGLMLELAGDFEGAARNMDRVLGSGPEPELRRQVQEKKAGLLLRQAEGASAAAGKKILAEVEALGDDMQFGGPYWVTRGALVKARARLAAGHTDAALELLDEQKRTARSLDRSFEEAGASPDQSPLAGWHFVRGLIHQAMGEAQAAEAKTDQEKQAAKQTLAVALNEYARVLKNYGGSPYATDAMVESTAVEEALIQLGAQIVRREAAPQLGAGQADQLFRAADAFLKEEKYTQAVDAYLKVLNKMPESGAAPKALGNLARAYASAGDLLMVQTVAGYLAERFAGRDDAARASLLLASYLRQADQVPAAIDVYRLVGRYFPDHEKAPAALHTVALSDRKAGRRTEALATLNEIVVRYPKSEFYLDALTVLGSEHRQAGDYAKALEAWSALAEAAPEGRRKAAALMFEADALFRLGETTRALSIYADLAKTLDPSRADNPYYGDDKDREEVTTLWEQADLQVGYCLAELGGDADAVAANLGKAVKVYQGFAARHPGSPRAAKAMAAQGGVLLRMDRVDEAAAVFDQLSRDYPDTPEGKNSLFTLASTAVQVGNLEVARDAVKRMADDASAYGADMLAAVGQIMLTNNLYDEALAVYEHVRRNTDDATLQEYALFGMGKSQYQRGAYREAIEALDALLALNDRTALFYEAKFLLGRARRETGDYDGALAALTDVFKFTRDPKMKRQADLELALLQEQQGRNDAAYASYLRIALHPDPTADPEVAALVERGMLRAMALGMELGAYEDVLLLCDRFLSFFEQSENLDQVRQARREAGLEQARRGPATAAATGP